MLHTIPTVIIIIMKLKRLARRILRHSKDEGADGPTNDPTYNKLTRQYIRSLGHSNPHITAEARQKLYDRHLQLGVQNDGTAFRGEENQTSFLRDRMNDFDDDNNDDSDEYDDVLSSIPVGGSDTTTATEPPPNKLVSQAKEDPADPSEPPPPEEKQKEEEDEEGLSTEFVSNVLVAIQKNLDLVDIIPQEDRIILLNKKGWSQTIDIDDMLSYIREMKGSQNIESIAFSPAAVSVGQKLMEMMPGKNSMREEMMDALLRSDEIPINLLGVAADEFLMQNITDRIQETVMPEKRVRREKALQHRIKQLVDRWEEENDGPEGGGLNTT